MKFSPNVIISAKTTKHELNAFNAQTFDLGSSFKHIIALKTHCTALKSCFLQTNHIFIFILVVMMRLFRL
jgi:hypothetical protein